MSVLPPPYSPIYPKICKSLVKKTGLACARPAKFDGFCGYHAPKRNTVKSSKVCLEVCSSIVKKTGLPCTRPAKFDGFCGIHAVKESNAVPKAPNETKTLKAPKILKTPKTPKVLKAPRVPKVPKEPKAPTAPKKVKTLKEPTLSDEQIKVGDSFILDERKFIHHHSNVLVISAKVGLQPFENKKFGKTEITFMEKKFISGRKVGCVVLNNKSKKFAIKEVQLGLKFSLGFQPSFQMVYNGRLVRQN